MCVVLAEARTTAPCSQTDENCCTRLIHLRFIQVETMSAKVKQADKFNIPMVKEEWVWKSIELGRKMNKMECKDMFFKNAPQVSDAEKAAAEKEARKRKAAELEAEYQKKKAESEQAQTEERFQVPYIVSVTVHF